MRRTGPREQGIAFAVLVLALEAFAATTQNNYYLNALFMAVLFAGMAVAWNIVGGFAGQFSLGHAAFFGIGAYTSTILLIHGVTPLLGALLGALLAGLFAFVIGLVAFSLRGPFFALATIAFAEALRIVAVNSRAITHGNEGLLVPITQGFLYLGFTDKHHYVYLGLTYLAVTFGVALWVVRSKLGTQLAAVREDEDAARAIGINSRAVKAKAALISASLTAVAGTLYAQYLNYIDPDSVLAFSVSLQPAIMAIIGGIGTLLGPVLGALLIVPLGIGINAAFGGSIHGLHLFVYGVVLIVIVLLVPNGIMGISLGRLAGWLGGNARAARSSAP